MVIQQLPADAPSPRLCCVKKSYENQEYGFNLHAEKGKGQFIGAVDGGSIAELAGLKPGDRIFAVNGFNIQGVSHKEVVTKIKSDAMQCELLVISEDGAKWYELHDIPIDTSLPNIIRPCKDELDDFGNYPNVSMFSALSQPSISETTAHLKLNHRFPPDSNIPRVFVTVDKKKPETKTTLPTDHTMNPRPRLCHLEKQNPTDEFGFNLHVEKGKGHFIGAVDVHGIADKAGLEMSQRIVGVNGELIFPHTPHKDVVGLIKRDPLSTDLLVASEEVDRWYTENAVAYSFDNAIIYNRPRGQSKVSVQNSVPNGSVPHSRKDTIGSQKSTEQLKTITNMQQEEPVQGSSIGDDYADLAPVEKEIHLDDHDYTLVTTIEPTQHDDDDDLINQVFNSIPLANLHYDQDAPHKPLEIEKDHKPLVEEVQELHVHDAHLEIGHDSRRDNEDAEAVHHTFNGHSPVSSREQSPKPAPVWVPPPPPPTNPPLSEYRASSPAASESSRSNGSSELQNKRPSHNNARDIFKLNAKEARQLLAQKKKDPRRQHMSLEQKHDIILNL